MVCSSMVETADEGRRKREMGHGRGVKVTYNYCEYRDNSTEGGEGGGREVIGRS